MFRAAVRLSVSGVRSLTSTQPGSRGISSAGHRQYYFIESVSVTLTSGSSAENQRVFTLRLS